MLQLWQVFSLAFLYTKHSEKGLLFISFFQISFSADGQGGNAADVKISDEILVQSR